MNLDADQSLFKEATMSHSRKDCITFFMTTQCNLECDYCYLKETKLPKESINVDFAKIALRDYFEKNSSRHIRFFGAGEPTLEFKKIVEIKKLCLRTRRGRPNLRNPNKWSIFRRNCRLAVF